MTKAIMARRTALLSSSSLGLAAVVSAASMSVALAPTVAAAQTVSCTAGVTPLSGAAVVISAGTYNPAITCLYVGDTATVATAGNITVSTVAPGGGINLSAAGADDINWTSTTGTVTGGAQTNGPVIDAQTTGAGNITLTTTNVTVNAAGTDGVFAQSLGAGTITLTTGSVGTGTASGSTAIEAISNGGNIAITTNGAVGSVSAPQTNSRDGIVAQTSGTGTVTLDINSAVTGYGAGGAAVRVTNGAGDVFIDASGGIQGGSSTSGSSAQLGSGLVIDSDGDIVVHSTGLIMGAINSTGPQPAAIVASGQTFTLTLTGNAASDPDAPHSYTASLGGTFDSDSIGGTFTGRVSPTVPGVGNTSRRVGGHVDLSGVTGGTELNLNTRARWVLAETSLMSPGADVVYMDATSAIMTSMMGDTSGLFADVDQSIIRPGVIDFGAGQDEVNSLGRWFIGPVYTRESAVGEGVDQPPGAEKRYGVRGEARLLGLEQFNNGGEIWLGSRFYYGTIDGAIAFAQTGTDLFHDDMLYMPGATFHGEEGSIIYMDVNLEETQASCAPETRDELGYLPAADCLGLQGGAATGVTQLRLYEFIPGDRGSYNPDGTVLVDLAGGDPDATDPGAFVISPDTLRYADIGNGAIDKGVFAYVLGFDADTQQFKLYGIPSTGGQQLPILATAANQLWHTSTGGWFQRQVDQRDVDRADGLGTGAWFNVTGSNATRDILTSIDIGTGTADFDNTYEQKDAAISFGWDLISHNAEALSWSLGAMVGYAQSEVQFEASDNEANLEGVHAGVYGGVTFGQFFVDGALNGTRLSLHNDVPTLGLMPTGTLLDTNVQSMGGRVEAGWRWDAGMAWVEPIVGYSAVNTEFDDFRVPNDDPDLGRPGVGVELDDSISRRASFGLRVGADDLMAGFAPTSLSLTARRVNEFEGGSDIVISNTGPDALMNDTFDGAFTQLTGSVGVSNTARTVSGYLNVDAVTGDDYDSLGISAGLRLQW